jgi:hypothetical protein
MGFPAEWFKPERETPFLDKVLQLAGLTRWLRAHFRPLMDGRGRWRTPVQGDGKGFPDVILIRGQTMYVKELKTDDESPKPEQVGWLDAFAGVGRIESGVWRPRDWDEIEDKLTGG